MAENGKEQVVTPAQFGELPEEDESKLEREGTANKKKEGDSSKNLDFLMDVSLQVAVELGRTEMTIREVLGLAPGSVVELNKLAGEPVDIMVNGKPMARGEVVVIDDMFGVRVTDIIPPAQRVTNLQ